MSGRLCYRREPGTAPVRTVAVHLHVGPTNSWATQNERLLRDHLLLHPDGAARYGDLKLRLAGEIDDSLAYARAKTALIQQLVARARSDRGLPQVNAWPESLVTPGQRRTRRAPSAQPQVYQGFCAAAVGGDSGSAGSAVPVPVDGNGRPATWVR